MPNGRLANWQRQAWLTEYQACQHDNSSSGTSYWAMAAIFIGISSALLVGAVFGVISNKDLYEMWLKQLQGQPSNIQPPQIIIIVIGMFVVLLLSLVRLWLRRINFLQQINFHRMRDIERQLGMWKSWRVHGVDHWNLRGDDFDNEISDEDKRRLLEYQPQEFWRRWHTRPRYAHPSGRYYDWIFAVLIFLWLFLALAVSSLFKFPSSFSDLWITAIELLGIGAGDYFIIRFTRVR